MRLGETEIAAERAGLPHSNIGDILFELVQRGQFLLKQRRFFELMMRAQRADLDHAVRRDDLTQAL